MAQLEIAEFHGFPDGMNTALPAHEIPDTQARYLQDTLVELAGITRRRGPVQAATGLATFTLPVSGMTQTFNPQGQLRIAALEGDSDEAYLSVLSSIFDSKTQTPWTGTLPDAPYYLFDSKPALGGGAFIGTSKQYDAKSPVQALGFWKGGDKPNYSTGTVTVSQGSTTVSGSGTSWSSSNVSPGMFLFYGGADYLVGVVKSVDSTTQLTLEKPALTGLSAQSYRLQSVRGINPRVVKGRITTSGTTVTGANTKFKDQGLDSGTWDIYRARDLTFIGTVSSVTNNTSLTLGATAAVALDNERYVAIKRDGDYALSTVTSATDRKVGFLTAQYAGMQFYANQGIVGKTSRVWFSDATDPEALDLTEVDGDWLEVTDGTPQSTTSPIKAIVPAYNSLLILKENQAFALYGNTPEQFELKKLSDDGIFAGMSAQPYEGGVVYAGHNGIYFYDGVSIENITEDTLGQFYRESIAALDPTTYRMWSMLSRSHYFIFVEHVTPSVAVIKGTTSSTPQRFTICVYLPSQTVSGIHTNLDIRGALALPNETGRGVFYAVNTSSGGRICDADDLFDVDASDVLTCVGNTAGPDFYVESKKYDIGHPLIKKLWKELRVHYLVGGGNLKLDTIVGLNTVGSTSASEFTETSYSWDTLSAAFPTWDALSAAFPTWDSITDSLFFIKRIKFLKRSQFFQFRLYQTSTVTKAKIGPFALGFKRQRIGRI